MRSAVVVAGGYSTRFGERDKATASLAGTPLIRHVVGGIRPAVDEVVVNCRPEQRDRIDRALVGLDYRVALDSVPDRGPVAGVRDGCLAASGEWAFVAPCDLPFLGPDLVGALFEAIPAVSADADAVLPRAGGRRRPLAGVYDTDAAVRAGDAVLDRGAGAVRDLLAELSVATVPSPVPERAFRDVDTRAALRAAESMTAGETPGESGAELQ